MAMLFIRKNLSVIIFISTVLIASLILITNLSNYSVQKVSKQFINALVAGDNPDQYCTGEVLYRLKTRQIVSSESEVVSVKSTVIDKSQSYARVYIVAEMKLQDGVDVGFYEAELIKENGWKIYTLRETMPKMNSFSFPGKPDMDSIYKKSFSQISKGDITSLAGPAKTAYRSQPALNAKAEITDLETEILYNNKLVIAKHSYTYDQRKIKVLAHYYKTSEGYKIVAIQSI